MKMKLFISIIKITTMMATGLTMLLLPMLGIPGHLIGRNHEKLEEELEAQTLSFKLSLKGHDSIIDNDSLSFSTPRSTHLYVAHGVYSPTFIYDYDARRVI